MKIRDFVEGGFLDDLTMILVKELTEIILQFSNLKIKVDSSFLAKPPRGVKADVSLPCFILAKELKKNSIEIAKGLVGNFFSKENFIIERVEANGPYLNLFLNREMFTQIIFEQIFSQKDEFGHSSVGQGKKVMVEYSSPNTNKPQHLGHVRNNLLGWVCAELLASIGFKVIKSSIVNDRGIHICKSMLAYQKWGENKTPESEDIKPDHFVGNFYVLFAQELKKEENQYYLDNKIDLSKLDDQRKKDVEDAFLKWSPLSQEAQKMLQKWEEGNLEVVALWKKMNTWVYEGFEKTYQDLGVDFDKIYYESDLYQKGKDIITQALEYGFLTQGSDGEIIADLSQYKLGQKVVLRSDGTSIYITQDINLAKIKFNDFELDYSVYCIGSEQEYYMKQLFAILDLIGFPWAKNVYHLSYGMVNLPDGKMKSREGTVVDADDLISDMTEMSKEILLERYPNLESSQLDYRAQAIALASIKIHMLSNKRLSETIFDPKKSLSFEGNTGPYLQYAYARICSVLRKEKSDKEIYQLINFEVGNSEWELIKILNDFSKSIYEAAINYEPLYLLDGLFNIAHAFNKFYHHDSILKAKGDQKDFRLLLVEATKQVMKNGLQLLGVEALEVM